MIRNMFGEFRKVKARFGVAGNASQAFQYYIVCFVTVQFYLSSNNCSMRLMKTAEVGSISLGKLNTVRPSRPITYL